MANPVGQSRDELKWGIPIVQCGTAVNHVQREWPLVQLLGKRMLKVVIAEPDEGCRMLLELSLSHGPNVQVATASDGEVALRKVASSKPEVVLLEGRLPVLSGFDVCRALKGNPSTKAIKVVMVTTMAQEPDYINAAAAGVDLYVTKPFSPRDLRNRVFRLAGLKRENLAVGDRGREPSLRDVLTLVPLWASGPSGPQGPLRL